jgi:hypothetical protein
VASGQENIFRLNNNIHIEVMLGKPGGERPLGRTGRRWLNNIKMDLGEISWGAMDCNGLAQDRDQCRVLVNAAMNLGIL